MYTCGVYISSLWLYTMYRLSFINDCIKQKWRRLRKKKVFPHALEILVFRDDWLTAVWNEMKNSWKNNYSSWNKLYDSKKEGNKTTRVSVFLFLLLIFMPFRYKNASIYGFLIFLKNRNIFLHFLLLQVFPPLRNFFLL